MVEIRRDQCYRQIRVTSEGHSGTRSLGRVGAGCGWDGLGCVVWDGGGGGGVVAVVM